MLATEGSEWDYKGSTAHLILEYCRR